jgi:integrase
VSEQETVKRPRRSKGDGSIFKLPDGRWRAVIDLGYRKGRRTRKTFQGATRTEVKRRLDRARRQLEDGGLVKPGRAERLDAYLTRWLTTTRHTVRPSTFRRYQDIVRLHLAPALGHYRMDQLRPEHVQDMFAAKLKAGLSPQSVGHLRAVLRTALRQAVEWGTLNRNPAALAKPPRVSRHEFRILDPEAARTLLVAAEGDRLEALYSVALALGLRQGEALGLRWKDVDLDAGQLHVRHALQRVDGDLVLVEPKTDRSRRTLRLPPAVVGALRRHRQRQEAELGAIPGPTSFIFTSITGTPLDDSNVRKSFRQILARAGLPAIRFHDLRHSCATLLLAQGVPPRVIMDTLGHSSIRLTMNTYSHVLPELRDEAAAAMERALTSV